MADQIKKYVVLIICLSVGVVSCGEMDACDPPFFVIAGSPGASDSIKAQQKFQNNIGIFASSVASLENARIIVTYPDEIQISTIIQPTGGPDAIQKGNTIAWTWSRNATFLHSCFGWSKQKEFTVGLISRTDWGRWRTPVTITVTLNFRGPKKPCNNYPDGFYSKTIKWSPDKKTYPPQDCLVWDTAPNGYRGIWKK